MRHFLEIVLFERIVERRELHGEAIARAGRYFIARTLVDMGVANVDPEFLGAAGLNRVARFAIDPRDERSADEWFEVVAGEGGIFGCLGLMACEDICPKDLPLLEVNAYLRRRLLASQITKKSG